MKLPKILGIEATGLIAHDPSNHFQPGTKVLTAMSGLDRAHDGGYAEYTCVDASNVQAGFGLGCTGSDPGDGSDCLGGFVRRSWVEIRG